ncbi:hypothetical protein CWI42_041680 [Ordospora colligata]|uniref:Hpc2-related domain-containing protein n=1 Tax=Ordospora colligata OC4 TaxID=1354746 RepID=A0A0B2UFW0_9MICR|nr:uncharacterized protein M896_041690 [Ordospora colligata OC4]KHN69971.1 hypothetical protein M896_041690 [Ordospora colligata OC4]TBU16141.1 hypothetical protein CWI41_041680 [Ordospora colligata]TBU16354.1 hypothetical protein CWI40_041680 [Ordospora colligata]TBU19058.1 hypothetical protein CWI42_041680 [Ordospora colligata]
MNGKNGIVIQIDVMKSVEIDLKKKTKESKRPKRIDEYDYNDPFIEPFEGETQAVMVECNLNDFFVYRGELPYSAKKVLSVWESRSLREQLKNDKKDKNDNVQIEATKKSDLKHSNEVVNNISDKEIKKLNTAGEKKYRRNAKTEKRTTEYILSLFKHKIDEYKKEQSEDIEFESFMYMLMLKSFEKERSIDIDAASVNVIDSENRWNEYISLYLDKIRESAHKIINEIHTDIQDPKYYPETPSQFKGFGNKKFLHNLCEYHLLFVKMAFIEDRSQLFSVVVQKAHFNIRDLFEDSCKNAGQTQSYMIRYISHDLDVKNIFDDKANEKESEDE